MEKQTIQEKLFQIIFEQFGAVASEIKLEHSFTIDYMADSLDCVELLMECEDEFNISIPDEDAEKIKTVQEALDYLVVKIKEDK